MQTDLDAPRYRVVAVDLAAPERSNWREVVPEAAEAIDSVTLAGDFALVTYLQDARALIRVFTTAGAYVRDVALPDLGTVWGLDGLRDDLERFYAFTSYTTPTTIYRYDVPHGPQHGLSAGRKVDFDPDAYETQAGLLQEQGRHPRPHVHLPPQGAEARRHEPDLLYGYGGFNISMTPVLQRRAVAWMEMGGVFAVANLRGGGEYGEAWHEAGTKLQEAKRLRRFHRRGRVADREQLHRAAEAGDRGRQQRRPAGRRGAEPAARPLRRGAARVGVMDMLRFHQFTVGRTWLADYGSTDDAGGVQALSPTRRCTTSRPGTVTRRR